MSRAGEPDVPAAAIPVLAGERRAAARLLTRAEAHDPDILPALRYLYRMGGRARVIGITGPPGVGKSTFVDGVVDALVRAGGRVAVLAVDPSSPFSGGAVLGDRIRMSQHALNPSVYIRSLSARGELGGLSPAIGDGITILDAMGFDTIIIETVGVGQNEVDILSCGDCVVLLQSPGCGDDVQASKAGILEVADIFVVNKADLPGADEVVRSLERSSEVSAPGRSDGWVPPVLKAEAITGRGIDETIEAVNRFFGHLTSHRQTAAERRRRQLRKRVLAIAETSLRRRLSFDSASASLLDKVISRDSDPHELAAALLRSDGRDDACLDRANDIRLRQGHA